MSIDRGPDKDVVRVHTGVLLSHKKNEIMPLAASWMDLESAILCEVRQRRNIVWHPLYVESKKKWYKWTYLPNRKRLTDLKNELIVAGGEGIVREFGKTMYTAIFKMDNLLQRTGNSAQCYAAAWMGGECGGERRHVCVWLSPLAAHLKPSQHCLLISCALIQNKKLKK